MFDRPKYKDFAKRQLKNRWKIPVFMFIFTEAIFILLDIPGMSGGINAIDMSTFPTLDYASQVAAMEAAFMNPVTNTLDFVRTLISFIFELACISVYIKMSRSPEPVKFSDYIEGFSSWWRAVRTGLLQTIFVFFWSLLFVIPGIVKYYSYSMMFFLSAEFPDVSVRKTMQISKVITKGHKMDLFILDLSFLGWFILTGLTCGIAGLYVVPYYNMTKVNACHGLLKEAINRGVISMEDLRGTKSE